MDFRLAARLGLLAVATAEGTAALARHATRTAAFTAAQARARALRRPLVVVGDPDAGAHTRLARAYGCGDVCLDLNGCPACPVAHAVDITRGPISHVADDSAVVFVACVLEYVADPQAAWREVTRMAGGPHNVYLATVQPWTATAALYPGARWSLAWGSDLTTSHDDCGYTPDGPIPMGSECFAPYAPLFTAVTPARKVATLAVLAGLVAASIWPR